MRERADLLGGTLTIDSLRGEGTTIQADFPVMGAIELDAAQVGEQTREGLAARDKARDEARDLARDQWRDTASDAEHGAPHDQPPEPKEGE
jgi:hypothetical protein